MLHSNEIVRNEIVRNAALRVKCNGHVLELRDKYTWAFHGHVFFCILFAMLKGQVAMLKGQVAMLKGQVAMLKGQVSCHGEVSGLQELHPTPQLLHAFQNVTSALTFLH